MKYIIGFLFYLIYLILLIPAAFLILIHALYAWSWRPLDIFEDFREKLRDMILDDDYKIDKY